MLAPANRSRERRLLVDIDLDQARFGSSAAAARASNSGGHRPCKRAVRHNGAQKSTTSGTSLLADKRARRGDGIQRPPGGREQSLMANGPQRPRPQGGAFSRGTRLLIVSQWGRTM